MNTVNDDIIYNIVSELSYSELKNLCATNRRFHEICQDEYTWNILIKRDYPLHYKVLKKENIHSSENLYLKFKNEIRGNVYFLEDMSIIFIIMVKLKIINLYMLVLIEENIRAK